MNQNTKLSVIIPAYNETKRIVPTLERMITYFRYQKYSHEIIIVDDGSTDDIYSVVQKYMKMDPHIRLESYKENKGKGYAVRHGMSVATGDYRLFADADGAITIDHLDIFITHIENGNDVVIGSIELPGHVAKDQNQWYRLVLGKMAKKLIRHVATPGIYDTQRAFKLFTREAAKTIFERQTIEGWGFDIELLVTARQCKYRIKEVPVIWLNPDGSKVDGIRVYVSTLLELCEITTKSLFGFYRPRRYRFATLLRRAPRSLQ